MLNTFDVDPHSFVLTNVDVSKGGFENENSNRVNHLFGDVELYKSLAFLSFALQCVKSLEHDLAKQLLEVLEGLLGVATLHELLCLILLFAILSENEGVSAIVIKDTRNVVAFVNEFGVFYQHRIQGLARVKDQEAVPKQVVDSIHRWHPTMDVG